MIFIATIVKKESMSEPALKILFPVSLLKEGVELLDPDNTETIWEYYLLENISCGLVRDSKFSATGYDGCLADRFYQENSKTWVFHIPERKWSDGTVITSNEIIGWIESLRTGSKRHIKYLSSSEKITFSETERVLKIHFPFEMDTTILHELSLADSGLFPANYKTAGWSKTVGPYFVESWNFADSALALSANKYSPLFNNEMPKKAILTKLKDPASRNQIFKTIHFDVVPIVASANLKNTKMVLPNAPQVWSSHPMDISFFYFNYNNEKTHSDSRRQLFAMAVEELRGYITSLIDADSPFLPEDQMIPKGFSGRLDSTPRLSNPSKTNNTINIKLLLGTRFKEMPKLTEKMKSVFLNYGFNIDFEYADRSSFKSDEFAGIYSFLGNQQDASGSWSFLAGPPHGPLSSWSKEFQKDYDQVFNIADLKNRQKHIQSFHEVILNKYIAVPFMVGTQRYLLSESIDASNWNQFDSRIRIYDIRRK